MIKVFEAQHLSEAHLVCGLLHSKGISAEIQGSDLSTTLGVGIGVPGILPTVWISNPLDSERAFTVVSQFLKGNSSDTV